MAYSGELVPIVAELGEQDQYRFEQFSLRFHELWANYEDMRRSGFNPSGSYSAEGAMITRTGSDIGVSKYRLKGFFADYRHFSGKEPANFQSMCNLLSRIAKGKPVDTLVARQRELWRDAGILAGWNNDFSADDVIDALDKEEVFHTIRTGKGPSISLADVRERLDEEALWSELAIIVYHRMLAIRNVNYFIQPILRGRSALQVPNSR